jgi:hypothetical protein
MVNARSIIEQAGRKIQVIGRGQTMPAEETTSALDALNGVLSVYSAEGALVYSLARETFTLTGAQNYSIGSGGDFDTTAPVEIEAAFATVGDTDYRMKQVNAAEYASITDKAITGIPEVFYYETGGELGRIHIYPVGPSGAYTFTMWSSKPIASFADLTTDYTLPVGLEQALVYNLAVNLAPEYGKEPSPTVARRAKETHDAVMGFIRRNNYPKSRLDTDHKMDGNIYSGWLT